MILYLYVNTGWIKIIDLGECVVFTVKNGVCKPLGLIRDDPKLSVMEIIRTYDESLIIEVFFKTYVFLTQVTIDGESTHFQLDVTAGKLSTEVRLIIWYNVSNHLNQFSNGT